MTNDMIASTSKVWSRRRRTNRAMSGTRRSADDAPILDPQRRRVLVTGRHHSVQPFRQHIGVGSEEKRQCRKFFGIERFKPMPKSSATVAVELDLDRVDEVVRLGIAEAGEVLPVEAVRRARDLVGAQNAARIVLG